MAFKFPPNRDDHAQDHLLIATRNSHKVAEIRAILSGHCPCLSQNDIPGAPTIVEDEETFAGNARKKAEGLAAWLAGNPPALPDRTARLFHSGRRFRFGGGRAGRRARGPFGAVFRQD